MHEQTYLLVVEHKKDAVKIQERKDIYLTRDTEIDTMTQTGRER